MTSRASKLVLAAVLISSVPALAAANDRDRDCDHDRPVRPVVVVPPVHAPPPGYTPAPPALRIGWRGWQDGRGWQHRRGYGGGWRHRELEQVRAELATLDAQRAWFHAQNAWRPGKLRKYDRAYLERREQLERREHELTRVAWR